MPRLFSVMDGLAAMQSNSAPRCRAGWRGLLWQQETLRDMSLKSASRMNEAIVIFVDSTAKASQLVETRERVSGEGAVPVWAAGLPHQEGSGGDFYLLRSFYLSVLLSMKFLVFYRKLKLF